MDLCPQCPCLITGKQWAADSCYSIKVPVIIPFKEYLVLGKIEVSIVQVCQVKSFSAVTGIPNSVVVRNHWMIIMCPGP